MSDRYILDGKNAIECDDLIKWATWLNTADRQVKFESINGSRISTVFLGLDHSFGDGKPLIFETMVFDGLLDGEMDRCSTWDEALAMHELMVTRVKST